MAVRVVSKVIHMSSTIKRGRLFEVRRNQVYRLERPRHRSLLQTLRRGLRARFAR